MTDWAKFIQAKIKLAHKGAPLSPASTEARVPRGQHQVTNFPVLDLGTHPDISKQAWRLQVYGLVASPLELDWQAFQALPQTKLSTDFHCVTRWTRLDMNWQGVLARDLIALAQPLENARFVTLHSYDDYTTNLPLEVLLDEDVVIAHSVLGKPLSQEHGGPARMVVPKRYAWKSAKWLKAIELHENDRPGFWEMRGYHNEADPWKEERYGYPPKE